MHMQNELLSPPVAAVTFAVASLGIGFICKKAQKLITHDKLALMGILGAFIFAGQMINFPLPLLPGTSGHLTGAVLLAILLGPWAASVVMSSVIIVQCLIFQDGGIMAIGCNLINMAIVPSFVGYAVYKLFAHNRKTNTLAMMLACVITVIFSSALVPLQAALSGVLAVPLKTFMLTMITVHSIIGIIEGVITVAVVSYLKQVSPEIFSTITESSKPLVTKKPYIAIAALTLITAAVFSLFASSLPDGLEWSYSERPTQPEFSPMIENNHPAVTKAEHIQAQLSPLPDYSIRTSDSSIKASAGWTSFAGVTGSIITMAVIWLCGRLIQKKESLQNAPHAH